MQDEPGTSNDTHIGERGEPATIVASSIGGEPLPPPILENPENGKGMMPQANADTAAVRPAYVYAIGQIEPRFPTLSVEKEFAQATGRAETAGLSDRRALHKVLSQRENRYLAREMCWVFTIEGLDTYILQPLDPADFDLLVAAVRPTPRPTDVDVVIGIRGPIATFDECNGLMVPKVIFKQIYSFDVPSLINAIPRPKKAAGEEFADAEELFYRLKRMADNAGATDEQRALNYMVMRNDQTFKVVIEASRRNCSLTAVEVRPSPLSGTERIMEVCLCLTHRQTNVTEKVCGLVNVTGMYPFLERQFTPTIEVAIGGVR